MRTWLHCPVCPRVVTFDSRQHHRLCVLSNSSTELSTCVTFTFPFLAILVPVCTLYAAVFSPAFGSYVCVLETADNIAHTQWQNSFLATNTYSLYVYICMYKWKCKSTTCGGCTMYTRMWGPKSWAFAPFAYIANYDTAQPDSICICKHTNLPLVRT